MQLIEEIGIKNLEAYGDSKLIINQVRGEYEVQLEDLMPYHNATTDMGEKFKIFYINHVPCQHNAHANALASLAASFAFSAGSMERILIYSRDLYYCKFTIEDSKNQKGDLQVKEVRLR